jgi:hypothetical protein
MDRPSDGGPTCPISMRSHLPGARRVPCRPPNVRASLRSCTSRAPWTSPSTGARPTARRGPYLCSRCTMYRVLGEDAQVCEHGEQLRAHRVQGARTHGDRAEPSGNGTSRSCLARRSGPTSTARTHRHLQPRRCGWLLPNVRAPYSRANSSAGRAEDPPGKPGNSCRPWHVDDLEVARLAFRRSRCHQAPLPTPHFRREPVLRGPFKTLKYSLDFSGGLILVGSFRPTRHG